MLHRLLGDPRARHRFAPEVFDPGLRAFRARDPDFKGKEFERPQKAFKPARTRAIDNDPMGLSRLINKAVLGFAQGFEVGWAFLRRMAGTKIKGELIWIFVARWARQFELTS